MGPNRGWSSLDWKVVCLGPDAQNAFDISDGRDFSPLAALIRMIDDPQGGGKLI